MFKFLSEVGPVIAFFGGFFYGGGIQSATLYMLITSVVCITLCYLVDKKISNLSLISSGVLLLSSTVTLISGNSMYIKIKPTILYTIFGCIFLGSAIRNNPFMKYALTGIIHLREKSWVVLSYHTAGFFFFMSILNEIVWRNFSELTWVKFKVFGVIPITLVFLLLQIPYILKHRISDNNSEK